MASEYTTRIGDSAGQGTHFIGGLLAKCFSVAGFHTFTHQDYMSRIKGGHNFHQIRIDNHPVSSSPNTVDILLAALNQKTIKHHYPQSEFLEIPFAEIITRQKTLEEHVPATKDTPLINQPFSFSKAKKELVLGQW